MANKKYRNVLGIVIESNRTPNVKRCYVPFARIHQHQKSLFAAMSSLSLSAIEEEKKSNINLYEKRDKNKNKNKTEQQFNKSNTTKMDGMFSSK